MGRKKVSPETRRVREKLRIREKRTEGEEKNYMRSFLKTFLCASDFKRIKNKNRLFFFRRRRRKLTKATSTDISRSVYRKALAAATHFWYRTEYRKSNVIPYQLVEMRQNLYGNSRKKLINFRMFKQTQLKEKNKSYRQREKLKYSMNCQHKEKKKADCKKRYQDNVDVKLRERFRNRKRYQENQFVRERESARNRQKYRDKPDAREKIIRTLRERYCNDPELREEIRTKNRCHYQNNPEVKERESARMRTRYQENKEFRERMLANYHNELKDKQKVLKQLRYNTIEEVREKVKISARNKYHKTDDSKLKERKRCLSKYHNAPQKKKENARKRRIEYNNDGPTREKKRRKSREAYQSDPVVCQREKLRNKIVYHDRPERKEAISKKAKERYRANKEESASHLEKIMKKFFEKISRGPTEICTCCGGLFYLEATRTITCELMENKHSEILENVTCASNNEAMYRFCTTCHASIQRNKVPRLALSNGLDFPALPNVLTGLTRLEQRLVAPRIPFLTIRPLGVEEQWGISGHVVNIENNLDVCVNSLPRTFDETHVTQLKFKRRMSYKGHYMYEKIRPKKVLEATRYLLQTPLFREHNILLNENWDHSNSDLVDFIVDPKDKEEDELQEEGEDAGLELDVKRVGAEESLFFTSAAMQSSDPKEIHIAPGEGKTHIPFFQDPDAEYLSFPAIYSGQRLSLNPDAKLSYGDIVKSELRRYDRRCATAEKVLYCFKRLFVKRVRDAYQICLRQKKNGDKERPVTAKDIRSPKFLENTINKDDGYTVYKHVRSTPSYWRDQVKRVVAMVRQLGNCTFFITLSAAETKWIELTVLLMKVVNGKDITVEEAEKVSFNTKKDMISGDPVTCARHFDHKLRALMGGKDSLIMSKNGIFAPHGISDHFNRIEYQMRGSPHSHGLYWMKDAPKYKGDAESTKACIEFIDKHITCERDKVGEMENLISYQNHGHTDTCKKNARSLRKCRFHFPKPPLPKTMILLPLPKETSTEDHKNATANYTKIEKHLDALGKDFDEIIQFDEFLKCLDLTYEAYIAAIRSTIKNPTVFLRRKTNAAFINNYNRSLLIAWKANLDIQFVLDPYACAKYCVGYMLKPEGGLSKLLRKAQDEGKNQNLSIAERLKKFGAILSTGAEISAQEAVGFVLGLKNTDSSRTHVFVNTCRSGGRIGILRPQEELNELPDESEDICVKGLLDHYSKRPNEMETVCLAEFATWYNLKGKGSSEADEDKENPKCQKIDAAPKLWLQDKSACVRKRSKAKILRYRHFSKVLEPLEYYREQLMLFLPWRDESKELDEISDAFQKYLDNINVIQENSKQYFHDKDFDESKLQELVAEQEMEVQDDEIVTNQLEKFEDERAAMADITEAPVKSAPIATLRPPRMMAYEDYTKIMRSLNMKQRQIVNEILYRIKTGKKPFYIFLTGGAGVGKSHVIMAIVQGIMYHKFYQPGTPQDIPVLVCAPTGKAAFNVNGITMHCAFKLTANQARGEQFRKMDFSTANTYRIKYNATELFVIDEISMTSGKQFDQIDDRFRQMFLNPSVSVDFGGKSILAVGDFRQLPPIPKQYIFRCPNSSMDGCVTVNPKWEKFEFFELDEIMRQKGELEFCKALNAMARGTMDEQDIALMKSREIKGSNQPPSEAVYLYRNNKDCQAYNARYHETLKTQNAISVATDTITGRVSRLEKEFHLERAKMFDRQKTDGIPYEVLLQVGGLYMITTNIDVADGLFNGSTGLLKFIEFASSSAGIRIPTVAWLEFSNALVGQETRNKYRTYQRPTEVPTHCVPIERFKRNCLGASQHINGCELVREQIPLIPANAMTICKSQGSSLPKVVVNTKISKLDREHLYVACSRATSREGLWIEGTFIPPTAPDETHPVARELERLQSNPVRFSQLFPAINDNYNCKIYCQNIRSFIKYKEDLEADQNVAACDFVCLLEPHVRENQNPILAGFQRVNFVPCHGKGQGDSQGSLIFSKADTPGIANFTKKDGRGHFIVTKIDFKGVYIFVCYKHPNMSEKSFLNELQDQLDQVRGSPVIITGDFNINIIADNGKEFKKVLMQRDFTSRIGEMECTTNSGTQIDLCFSNIRHLVASTYETYFSDHRGICIMFN